MILYKPKNLSNQIYLWTSLVFVEKRYNVKVPPDANIPHPPVSATSASCVFKKKITILLNKYKYKSAEIQSKKVVL